MSGRRRFIINEIPFIIIEGRTINYSHCRKRVILIETLLLIIGGKAVDFHPIMITGFASGLKTVTVSSVGGR